MGFDLRRVRKRKGNGQCHLDTTHNPFDEVRWASCLRENLMSSSYGKGLEAAGV